MDLYLDIFKYMCKGLPPSRGFEYTIKLELGAKPIMINPYNHFKIYKDGIEKIMKELLDMGFIQPSFSHFTSSFLLMKKKYETMRMCIEYCFLNKKNIKKKYPIPRVYYLIDEFHREKCFSKINLILEYHEIGMKEEDI